MEKEKNQGVEDQKDKNMDIQHVTTFKTALSQPSATIQHIYTPTQSLPSIRISGQPKTTAAASQYS